MTAIATLLAAISIWTASTTGDYHRVKVVLEPNDANRFVCFYVRQMQGGSQEKTSCWEVQGSKEPRTTWREVKDLSSGKWEFVAAVMRNDEQAVVSNRIEIRVLGPGYVGESTPAIWGNRYP